MIFEDNVILADTKKHKGIVYGAQSIKRQTGVVGRRTEDWDIFMKQPKQSAFRVERKLERLQRGNQFNVQPAMHPGTWKIKRGKEGVVDYTETPKPTPPHINIQGVRYRKLKEELKAKQTSLRDKQFAFRHEKDREDYNRIRLKMRVSKWRLI